MPSDAEIDAAVRVLKLLADHVGARPTAVSQHLARLRAADLVSVRRDGNRIFYAARNEHIQRLAAVSQAQVLMLCF